MWSAIETAAGTVWTWIPELTTALKFGTALIGFVIAGRLVVRRIDRWYRRRR